MTIDHVIPESKGGLTEPHNLVIACKSCNSKKGVKDAEDMSAIIQRNDSDG
ncbi:HNH endonuclease [Paenibacillus sp. S25]|nr:HNH endonuclease [Paenibacillus sp. S25]